jgi:hypothetical protein
LEFLRTDLKLTWLPQLANSDFDPKQKTGNGNLLPLDCAWKSGLSTWMDRYECALSVVTLDIDDTVDVVHGR